MIRNGKLMLGENNVCINLNEICGFHRIPDPIVKDIPVEEDEENIAKEDREKKCKVSKSKKPEKSKKKKRKKDKCKANKPKDSNEKGSESKPEDCPPPKNEEPCEDIKDCIKNKDDTPCEEPEFCYYQKEISPSIPYNGLKNKVSPCKGDKIIPIDAIKWIEYEE